MFPCDSLPHPYPPTHFERLLKCISYNIHDKPSSPGNPRDHSENNLITCPGNPSFLDFLFKHCDTAFQTFSMRYTVLSPTLQSSPGIQPCLTSRFLSLKYVFLHHSTKRDFLKVIANFLLPNSVVYLPPVAFMTFTLFPRPCQHVLLLSVLLSCFLWILLKFSCFFTGLSVLLVSLSNYMNSDA